MTYTGTISAAKANRLYWLGRYAERAYLNLHLLRKFYDKTIDGNEAEYEEYFDKLNISFEPGKAKEIFLNQMYGTDNQSSIIEDIERANDNAIVLREELMSETLSYIQLSRCEMQRNAEKQNDNIAELQPVTDYLLAFWGSVDERIPNLYAINILKAGRLVENIDMQLRFDYPFSRIRTRFDYLLMCADNDNTLFDHNLMTKIDELLTEKKFDAADPLYKQTLLGYLNNAVLL